MTQRYWGPSYTVELGIIIVIAHAKKITTDEAITRDK